MNRDTEEMPGSDASSRTNKRNERQRVLKPRRHKHISNVVY